MSTLKEIRDQVIEDLDLHAHESIHEDDLTSWVNMGIRDAEAEIHTLTAKYFLSYAEIPIVIGQNKVNYPADIYANRINKIIYTDGLEVATSLDIHYNGGNPVLEWMPVNITGEGRMMQLFPDVGRTGTLRVWYIRNATVLVLDDDVCDIDEFENYIIQYVKTQAYLKDGDPRADDSKILEEQMKVKMIETLEDMIDDDEDDKIEMDTSHYDESIG